MATARPITNSNTSTNPDYEAKVTSTVDGDVQHVNIDNLSGVSTEVKQDDIITELNTLNAKDFATELTLSSIDGKITACDTSNVTVSGFNSFLTLLNRIFAFLKNPPWVTRLNGTQLVKASLDQVTATVGTVTTVSTVTNVNGINGLDSRWLIYNQWNQNYRLGIRARIN